MSKFVLLTLTLKYMKELVITETSHVFSDVCTPKIISWML
jgi:hypothetical protein